MRQPLGWPGCLPRCFPGCDACTCPVKWHPGSLLASVLMSPDRQPNRPSAPQPTHTCLLRPSPLPAWLPARPPARLQRFTFTAVDVARSGETHPRVIPIGPVNGMKMLVE
jgi:hypothetical protein